MRRCAEGRNALSRNWQKFLRHHENKFEVSAFLANLATSLRTDKQITSTLRTGVCFMKHPDTSGLVPCSQEEADTRIILHLQDALKKAYTTSLICIVGTDIFVLAIAAANCLTMNALWVTFGTGNILQFMKSKEQWDQNAGQHCQCSSH